ncbi:MAG: c-type cytochrome [Nitriliruptoraceae bacterium]
MSRTLRLALLALVTLSACASSPDAGSVEGSDDAASEVAVRGRELFAANCAACHGVAGTGTTSGPPLVHIIYEPSHHGDGAFHRAVREGVTPHHWDFGPMPPVSGLSDADIDHIIGYVREQQRAAGIE